MHNENYPPTSGGSPYVVVRDAGTICPTFPALVIAAQIDVESRWGPRARSAAGGAGIAQFMPDTWGQRPQR